MEVLRTLMVGLADRLGLSVDHKAVDQAAAYCAQVVQVRPPEPQGTTCVWYRGWEVGWDHDAAFWGGTGWRAYKGGCDLDALEVMSETYQGCLDEIDEQEDE